MTLVPKKVMIIKEELTVSVWLLNHVGCPSMAGGQHLYVIVMGGQCEGWKAGGGCTWLIMEAGKTLRKKICIIFLTTQRTRIQF